MVTAATTRAALALAATGAVASGCGSGSRTTATTAPRAPAGSVLLARTQASALAALPGGALLVGSLKRGQLRRVDRDGTVRTSPLTVPRVSTAGQRGLLSLVADGARVYASWTEPGGRLVVGELRRGAPRIVWSGPPSTTLANGGHLALTSAPRPRLVIGLGDRQSPRGAVGRLVSLSPAGPATQRPRVLSRGWWNPFAFAFTPGGRLWVADNAPGERPERLARGDAGRPRDVTTLAPPPAPSGLAALPGGDLALCGFVSGTLDRYHHDDDGRWRRIATLASGCRYGVVRLTDGRLAFGADDAIRSVAR